MLHEGVHISVLCNIEFVCLVNSILEYTPPCINFRYVPSLENNEILRCATEFKILKYVTPNSMWQAVTYDYIKKRG